METGSRKSGSKGGSKAGNERQQEVRGKSDVRCKAGSIRLVAKRKTRRLDEWQTNDKLA